MTLRLRVNAYVLGPGIPKRNAPQLYCVAGQFARVGEPCGSVCDPDPLAHRSRVWWGSICSTCLGCPALQCRSHFQVVFALSECLPLGYLVITVEIWRAESPSRRFCGRTTISPSSLRPFSLLGINCTTLSALIHCTLIMHVFSCICRIRTLVGTLPRTQSPAVLGDVVPCFLRNRFRNL
ncbi:hypothetical protein N657DRAFT_14762 [Parathielavia appendiculata]|uniref:Uncharacterized protein n=1 Tax=Parathielavia appendiculata TaxID=2587402 RepID=A0AAN6Z8M1_9PEZI|nr:hypothetical protein N657DRAFT_14762 [Parathielavia appendiculata]